MINIYKVTTRTAVQTRLGSDFDSVIAYMPVLVGWFWSERPN